MLDSRRQKRENSGEYYCLASILWKFLLKVILGIRSDLELDFGNSQNFGTKEGEIGIYSMDVFADGNFVHKY